MSAQDDPTREQSLPSPSELLRAYARPAKKRYGQNFLTDPRLLDKIVALATTEPGQEILEIGPGPGGLTSRLLSAGARVRAIEMDPDAVAFLRGTLALDWSLDVIEGDALSGVLEEELDRRPHAVIGNLPYHVATEILFRMVDHVCAPRRMVLMFQREVAERIVAPGASRTFGLLALGTQLRYRTRIALQVAPGSFLPPPKVRSSVVVLEEIDPPIASDEERAAVRMLGRSAFGQRRKQIRNALGRVDGDTEQLLERAEIEPSRRAEELCVEDFLRLARVWIALRRSV